MIFGVLQAGLGGMVAGALLGGVLTWAWQEDRVDALQLNLALIEAQQREAERQSDARVKVAQAREEEVRKALAAAHEQRKEDYLAFDKQLDQVTNSTRVALSAATTRLLNAGARARSAQAGADRAKVPGPPAEAAADTERYFATSERALSKWVSYAMRSDEENRAQIEYLVDVICSRPDVFTIVNPQPGVFVCQ